MKRPQEVLFALVEDFTYIAFACALEPLRLANLVSGQELYRWSFASADGATATSSNGAVTLVHHKFDALPRCDRLLVISGLNVRQTDLSVLIASLSRERRHGTAIGAFCSGAYVLAKAGLP